MTKEISIGIKIKKLREIKGFKQEFMAEQLSISQQSYSNIENGKIDVPFSKLENIADILGLKIEDLISFDDKYVLNNFGENKGHQIVHYSFPEEMKQLYEDKINLLQDKVRLLEDKVKSIQTKSN